MATPWDQMPDYVEAVRRERRAGDPTKYESACKSHCADDVTEFIVGQAQWTLENLPNILYTIKRPEEQLIWGIKTTDPPVKLDANGRPLLERWPKAEDIAEARPLRDIPILPDQICYFEKWWRVEAWRRLDPRITYDDIAMRQMPEGGIRTRANGLDTRRLYRMDRYREEFYLLNWYNLNKNGSAQAKRIYDKFEPKQLQHNCSRGATPGLIDPAKGEVLGNRVPLPYAYGMIPGPNILSEKSQSWKPLTVSQLPATIQPSTRSSVRESRFTGLKQVYGTPSPNAAPDDSDEESDDSHFSEGQHSAGSFVKHEPYSKNARLTLCDKEPDLEAQRRQRNTAVGDTKERLKSRLKDSEEDHRSIQDRTTHKQTKAKRERRLAASSKAIDITELSGEGQNLGVSEGEASSGPMVEMKTSEARFMRTGKIQRARTLRPSEHNQHKDFDDNSTRQAGKAEQESRDGKDLPCNESPRTFIQDINSNPAQGAERIAPGAATFISIPNDQGYKTRSKKPLVYTVKGAPRLRPQSLNRNVRNANTAEPKCELVNGSPPVAVAEASNEYQDPASARTTNPLSVGGKRRQKRQLSPRPVSHLDRDDQERGKVQRSPSPLVWSSEDDMELHRLRFARASPRSTRAVRVAPRYNLRKRLNSGDESESYRRQHPEMNFPVHARISSRTQARFSNTNSEKFIPSTVTPSESDEITGIPPRAKRFRPWTIGPRQRFPREQSRKRSVEARVESDTNVSMKDMPLTANCEPRSSSSAEVVPSSPEKDAAVAETKGPTAPGPSNRSQAASGISMDTFVEDVIELRSRISSLEPRGSLTSKSLGEQADRVAKMAIELRAGTNRLLDEIASLREAVDRYNGLR